MIGRKDARAWGVGSPTALAAKAGLATALALAVTRLAGVPDSVSSTLVAVICVSPTVLAGLQRARTQALASLLGGALATAIAFVGLPVGLGLPVAVALTALLVVPLGLAQGLGVAAFTAIYVFLLPKGDPEDTLLVRMAAVGIGAGSAMLVNSVVSALSYRRIFARRMRVAAERLAEAVEALADGAAADSILPTFGPIGELNAELVVAERELLLRQAQSQRDEIAKMRRGARNLGRIAHFARDLSLALEEAQEPMLDADRVVLRHVAARLRGRGGGGHPEPAGEIGARLLASCGRYCEAMRSETLPSASTVART